MKHEKRFLGIVEDALSRVKEIGVGAVKKKIDGGEDFHLFDVREESEWDKSRLPRAIHLGKGIIERDIEKTVPESGADIVLYCGGGFRSALAADNLAKMGYTNVWSMAGGVRDWKEAGFALEEG